MKKKWLWPVIIIVVLVVIFTMSYNGFVSAEENVSQSYSQIETQLQRRVDLVPNLVSTVKGYASHEKQVLTQISDARARLAGAKSTPEKAKANDALTGALSRLLVIQERYPDLKADKQFTQLMDELAGTENRIAVSRRDYNEQVATYNKKVKRFPGTLVASLGGFHEKDYFKSSPTAKEPPKVNFGEQQ
ncbi:LemA family protein [Fictibacillus macauensis ZFHKF-1]|uniref:LemA family protein n=1 Tax=Fictibacillus macauensis ZFHKF-1 TaxID=1196324 RepID=I8UED5_9BACL|nr:LemA family protein [Fictibacillus macauensis]EIT85270.1 LemA family protein [Fictibacillus macauensis ZFHKF-1]